MKPPDRVKPPSRHLGDLWQASALEGGGSKREERRGETRESGEGIWGGGTILSYRESYREILNKPTVTPVVSRGISFFSFFQSSG